MQLDISKRNIKVLSVILELKCVATMQVKEENMYLNIHGRINYKHFFKIDLLTDFAALGIGVL